MKTIKVVIGANFGDEGKGLMTDYFVNRYNRNPVLNVRFNGGSQAAHTVVTPEGRRHIFSHFGAGTFAGGTTYLAEKFILNPLTFIFEHEKLFGESKAKKVYVHKDCIFTLPSDMLINQIVEEYRANKKHGSCGLGIFETVVRNRDFKSMSIHDVAHNFSAFKDYINNCKENYVYKRLKSLGVENLTDEQKGFIESDNITQRYIADMQFMLGHIEIVDNTIINEFDTVVFEGAQGLLLDNDNKEYYPNISASKTGVTNVVSILKELDLMGKCDLEVCYVTRAYFTRHGAGAFKTECDAEMLGSDVYDLTNMHNIYQDSIRYGYFDAESFLHYTNEDIKILNGFGNVTYAMTHLDQTDGKIAYKDSGALLPNFNYSSYGFTRNNIKEEGLSVWTI